jgi:hypothetical protein
MFSLLDSRARILKPVPSPAGTPQAAVDQAIKNLPWLGSSVKVYRFSHEQLVFGGLALPAFVRIAPANSWGLLFIMLAHRLGLQAWDCKVSRLANTCTEVIPRVAHLPEYKAQASKVARWLRDLSAEERLAWQELGTTCRAFTDQEGMDLLASVIARMAIMIHPDHQGALGALQQMRVDLPVLRNLEGWLLGPAYSDYRQTQNLLSRIMVPLNLRRLPGISVPSTSQ